MKKALIVDDSASTRSKIASILLQFDLDISESENGRIALEWIRNNQVDIVFLDLLMPEMDGFEVLENLKNQGFNRPIIVISADIQEDVKEDCFRLGAVAFLNKPFKDSELIEIINKMSIHGT